MNKSFLVALFAIITGLYVSSAPAALPQTEVNEGAVNFNGNMIASACTIATGTQNQVVDLGHWDSDALKATVSGTLYGNEVPFSITLNHCDSSVAKNVQVAFTGHTGRYFFTLANMATDTPSNLELVLLAMGDTPTNLRYSALDEMPITNGVMILRYAVIYTSEVLPTPGNTLYLMTYTIKYL